MSEELDKETVKELVILQNEIKGKNVALDLDKEAFKKKLMGDMGEKMIDALSHPKKPSFWVGLKYKYARWKTIRDGNRAAKKIIKMNKKNGDQ